MPRTLSKQLVISQADGTLPHRYGILEDEGRELQWFEGSDSEDTVRAGQPVVHKWNFFGGGACETVDIGKGGYFFSTNCTVCNPFRIRPRPETTSVTLTSNAVPVERFFEADDGTNKYVYCLAGAKSFKIKEIAGTPALAETKNFTTTGFYFASGKYLGDGKDNRQIKGVGFQPDALILKSLDNTDAALLKTSTMAAYTKKWTADWDNDDVLSLGSDGFTVSDATDVNKKAIWYYWQAWKADGATVMKVGSYTGNGVDGRQYTDVGFQPDLVHIGIAAGTRPVTSRSSSLAGDKSFQFTNDADVVTNRIQDFIANGFELGDDLDVNGNGSTYHYVAFKAVTGAFAVGTYTGNGADDRSIAGFGFAPTYAIVVCESSAGDRRAVQASHKGAADITWWFYASGEYANYIQAFEVDGIQVGSANWVNRSGSEFHWMAWRGRGAVGKPAPWNRAWRVPLGTEVGIATLQEVYDESGAADDTWVVDPIPADHLQRLKNKLARSWDQYVTLCSADDIGNRANWGAAYGGVADVAIGTPDVEITDLVEWKAELAVCTTDGMYMFDGVATSKQQLPNLGGIKDDDNGKNTLNWMGQVLVPTKGGLLRWSYGAAKPVGPDSIFGYVEAEGVSNEPIHLQHFGLTYLEDWIYAAVYDGTNYHIIYARPFGEGFRWDFLLTSSSAIKALFVDSNARLWFGLGNNLSSIQLKRSGAPTGGNYGEASLTGSFYTSEKVLADGANVRCRMAKVETDNNQSTLTWKLYSIRDGATAEQVGAAAGFKTDGEQKLYWAAASNLLARRLRYRLDFACSSFSPETTPPECLVLEFHGDALPDDADLIRVVVSLDSEGRANKTVYDELAAHENAGVRKVRSPITDETLTVSIYRREMKWVKQRGTEPPKVGVMLYMRRGDVA